MGYLFDNYGPNWLLRGGSVAFVIGLVLMSFADKYYQTFLTQGLLVSLGCSAVFNASTATVVRTVMQEGVRRRKDETWQALPIAVMTSGASIGGVVLPIMMKKLVERIGFSWMMRVLALIFTPLLSATCWCLNSKIPSNPRPFRLPEYFKQLHDLRLALTSAAFFFFMLGMFLPFNYLLLQAKSAGASASLTTYLLSILNGSRLVEGRVRITHVLTNISYRGRCSVFGRLLGGYLADKMGHYLVITVMAMLCAVSCLAIWLPFPNIPGIVSFAILFGFSSGGYISLCPTVVRRISEMKVLGARIGAAFAMQAVGALAGSPLGGAIVAWQDGAYTGLQIFCGCSMLCSGGLFVAAAGVSNKQRASEN